MTNFVDENVWLVQPERVGFHTNVDREFASQQVELPKAKLTSPACPHETCEKRSVGEILDP